MAPLPETAPPRGWVVSPAFDLLFLANLPWLLVLVPAFGTGDDSPLAFWQLYFLTTPHRWITLFLVAVDPDRREGWDWFFLGLAVAVAGAVFGVYLVTGDFTCLALVDAAWNGWHFASQHAGVLAIYGKKVGGGSEWLERWGTRFLVAYVALRALGFVTGYLRVMPEVHAAVRWLDLAVLLVPLSLLLVQLRGFTWDHLGKLAYVASVCVLYSAFLLALWAEDTALALRLALGSAIFHATEYLAIVTHYAWRRREHGSDGAFRTMALNWMLVLVGFALVLGLFAATWGTALGAIWVGANLTAAFLHYAYDGMIWKLRRPATAQTLGLSPNSPPG